MAGRSAQWTGLGVPLHLINFVRTQAELLNSFYGHGLGHLYDAPTFLA